MSQKAALRTANTWASPRKTTSTRRPQPAASPGGGAYAEADGNRTRLRRGTPHTGFEDRGGHQAPGRLRGRRLPAPGRHPPSGTWPASPRAVGGCGQGTRFDRMTGVATVRLTQYARGGGCACKIPPGELEETVSKLV